MTNTEIKATMESWYEAWIDRDDESYFELYNAFKTMRSANLITDSQWKMIYTYDRELAEKFI